MIRVILYSLLLTVFSSGQRYESSSEVVPPVEREFRAAWVACVYNIDWPTRAGLGIATQQAELRAILDRMVSLKMNAMIFQVRPNADAVYQSSLEPWSHWVSGVQGKSPGYDPLAYCLEQAHERGIEVHAWFNPFRALPNRTIPTANNHVVRTHPSIIRDFKTYQWMDPSSPFARERALAVIMDVVNRYDVDGVHIDDYFYPYPDVDAEGRAKQVFPDGKTPEARRAATDGFVKAMYAAVKARKPWVRVGISPFGIWRPGVPEGTTARIDAYHHLAADSRKWLQEGWCDYLSPQLYWRIEGPQSFRRLLGWWRTIGTRPVWPGLATARINSTEDPGRPVSEMIKQVALTRSMGSHDKGHVFWSMTSLMKNRGGISDELVKQVYQEHSLVPPMPWLSRVLPKTPVVLAEQSAGKVKLVWTKVPDCTKYVVQTRTGETWQTRSLTGATKMILGEVPDAIAVSAVDRYGNLSPPRVVVKR